MDPVNMNERYVDSSDDEVELEEIAHQNLYFKVRTSQRHRRFVSFIVTLLLSTSFIYLVAGPWVGWSDSRLLHTFFTVCSMAALMKWPLKKLIYKITNHSKAKRWQVQVYCMIPWRTLSRAWGLVAGIPIPTFLRPLVYGVYSKTYGVTIEEAEEPMRHYGSLCQFFTRRLKENARQIDTCGLLVTPCDGTVVQCGPISDKYVKKVKGVDYCIERFLGIVSPALNSLFRCDDDENVKKAKTQLFHCVLYLAPGDYHRFHSPCKWEAQQRLHFGGELLSVAPVVARWMPNLLAINERVVYHGLWDYGYFSYTAVGATNVGSILIHTDPTLQTNKPRSSSNVDHVKFSPKLTIDRGEEFGLFAMGSTIVLIFEAPENFHFTCSENDKVKMGSCLGGIDSLPGPNRGFHNSQPTTDSDNSDNEWIENEYDFIGSEKLFVS